MIDEKKLLEEMDLRYKEKYGIVPNNLAEGFAQVEKLIKEQPQLNYPLGDCVGDCKNCWKTKLVNPQWIPCSERLPEEREGEFYPLMYITNQYGKVKIGFYRVNDKQWYVYGDDMEDSTMVDNDYVIAWQDEPKPYEG